MSKKIYIGLILAGGLIFITAQIEGLKLFKMFLDSKISMVSIILATLLIPFFWYSIEKHHKIFVRLFAGAQTLFIILGWFAAQFPVLIFKTGGNLTIANTVAPHATILQLFIALLVGVSIILPLLVYLFRVFKT